MLSPQSEAARTRCANKFISHFYMPQIQANVHLNHALTTQLNAQIAALSRIQTRHNSAMSGLAGPYAVSTHDLLSPDTLNFYINIFSQIHPKDEMFQKWQKDPSSVHPSWDVYFRGGGSAASSGKTTSSPVELQDTIKLLHLLR